MLTNIENDLKRKIWNLKNKSQNVFIEIRLEETFSKLKKIQMFKRLLNPIKSFNAITSEMIERAKQYPIDDLIEFKQKVAKCIWHNDRTPSMYFYKRKNRVHCFGCGKNADSIDTFMQINNSNFNNAVKSLQ